MKRAIVVPLLKKDNLNIDEVKNYRPVSNLSFISKLLERVVSAQINGYLESHNLLRRDNRPTALAIRAKLR